MRVLAGMTRIVGDRTGPPRTEPGNEPTPTSTRLRHSLSLRRSPKARGQLGIAGNAATSTEVGTTIDTATAASTITMVSTAIVSPARDGTGVGGGIGVEVTRGVAGMTVFRYARIAYRRRRHGRSPSCVGPPGGPRLVVL